MYKWPSLCCLLECSRLIYTTRKVVVALGCVCLRLCLCVHAVNAACECCTIFPNSSKILHLDFARLYICFINSSCGKPPALCLLFDKFVSVCRVSCVFRHQQIAAKHRSSTQTRTTHVTDRSTINRFQSQKREEASQKNIRHPSLQTPAPPPPPYTHIHAHTHKNSNRSTKHKTTPPVVVQK